MASKTLLDTVKAVTGELGFSQPAVVVSSQVLTEVQLKYLTIAACDELLEAHDWQALLKTHTFTINGATSLYALPSDFHRMVNTTAFVGDKPHDGSAVPSTWTRLESGERMFRIIGDQLEVFEPATYAGQSFRFHYISRNYVLDGSGGLPKAEFTQDSDRTVFHARLLVAFVKLKMLQVKNLDTRAAAQDYNTVLAAALATDQPARVLSYDGEARFNMEWLGE